MTYCIERVSLLGSLLEVEVFGRRALLNALFPQGRPYAAVLHCVEGSLEVGCDPAAGATRWLSVRVAGTCKCGLSWSSLV